MGSSWRGDFTIRFRELKGLSMFCFRLPRTKNILIKQIKHFRKKKMILFLPVRAPFVGKRCIRNPTAGVRVDKS